MYDPDDDVYKRRNEAPLWWFNKSSDLHASAGALWLAMKEDREGSYQESLGLGRGFSMGVA